MKRLLFCLALLPCVAPTFAQRVSVQVLEKRDQETGYHGHVPGSYSGSSSGNTNCNAYGNTVNCQSSGSESGYYTAPHINAYNVSGATLSLRLPDGRIAIVNCASKYSLKMDYVNRRSCRVPLVDQVGAEFKGKSAKLFWSVSIDGKKEDSETYKILAVLPAPATP